MSFASQLYQNATHTVNIDKVERYITVIESRFYGYAHNRFPFIKNAGYKFTHTHSTFNPFNFHSLRVFGEFALFVAMTQNVLYPFATNTRCAREKSAAE